MKPIFIVFCMILCVYSCDVNQNTALSNKKQGKIKSSELSKISLRKYYGRSIHKLLEDIETKPKKVSVSEEPPSCISGCTIVYPNDTVLVIEFHKVYFQTQCDTNSNWDYTLINKEFIYRMGLHIKAIPKNMEYFGPKPLNKKEYRERIRESVKGISRNDLPIELVKDLAKE